MFGWNCWFVKAGRFVVMTRYNIYICMSPEVGQQSKPNASHSFGQLLLLAIACFLGLVFLIYRGAGLDVCGSSLGLSAHRHRFQKFSGKQNKLDINIQKEKQGLYEISSPPFPCPPSFKENIFGMSR